MKKIIASVVLATVALGIVSVPTSAHSASKSCESVTITNTPSSELADIFEDGVLRYDDVGNGTYQVKAGPVQVTWPLWNSPNNHAEFTIENCATPIPEPTPERTPKPTPDATRTPKPTPDDTDRPPRRTPRPTVPPELPPTDTIGPSSGDDTYLPIIVLLGTLLSTGAALFLIRKREEVS